MGIIRYRKKPVEIEALQWTGRNFEEIRQFVGQEAKIIYHDTAWEAGAGPVVAVLSIHTLEGDMKAEYDDYIIKGVNGEFYPCKPDIFAKTYEVVE